MLWQDRQPGGKKNDRPPTVLQGQRHRGTKRRVSSDQNASTLASCKGFGISARGPDAAEDASSSTPTRLHHLFSVDWPSPSQRHFESQPTELAHSKRTLKIERLKAAHAYNRAIFKIKEELPMSSANARRTNLKHKITYQLEELAKIFLYLAFFFCAVTTYSMLLLNNFHVFNYVTALVNALVVGKLILLGEDAHLGKRHETKPLLVSTVYKSILFGLLVFAFHIVEEMIRRLVLGEHIAGAFHNVRLDDFLARSVIGFCVFIPLFGFLELRRVLGNEKMHDLWFRAAATATSDLSDRQASDK